MAGMETRLRAGGPEFEYRMGQDNVFLLQNVQTGYGVTQPVK
jgi:hypothetical protein